MSTLRPKENLSGRGVQGGRKRPSRPTKIGYCGGVVAEQRYRHAHDQMFEGLKAELNCQKLPHVDRESFLMGRPKTRGVVFAD